MRVAVAAVAVKQFPWMTARAEAAANRLILGSLSHLLSETLQAWQDLAQSAQETRRKFSSRLQLQHTSALMAAIFKRWTVCVTDASALRKLFRIRETRETRIARLVRSQRVRKLQRNPWVCSIGGCSCLLTLPSGEWRGQHTAVEMLIVKYSKLLMVSALTGTVAACVQHELLLNHGRGPHTLFVDLFKALNTGVSLLSLALLYRVSWLQSLYSAISKHHRYFTRLNVDITAFTPLGSAGFWLQAQLCVLHLPPGCSADIPLRPHWSASQGAQRVLYRAESLAAVLHMLRLYFAWAWWLASMRQHQPKHHVIATITRVQFDAGLLIKMLLSRSDALPRILFGYVMLVLVAAFCLRAAEPVWSASVFEPYLSYFEVCDPRLSAPVCVCVCVCVSMSALLASAMYTHVHMFTHTQPRARTHIEYITGCVDQLVRRRGGGMASLRGHAVDDSGRAVRALRFGSCQSADTSRAHECLRGRAGRFNCRGCGAAAHRKRASSP